MEGRYPALALPLTGAGTWKAGTDFHVPTLLARAELHRQRGEVDESAELMRRAAMHGAVSGEEP